MSQQAESRHVRSAIASCPVWLRWCAILWVPFLVAWIPIVYELAAHHDPRHVVVTASVIFGGTALVATMTYGAMLGFRRTWKYLAFSIPYGTMWIGLIVFQQFVANVPANQDNPGVGLGAALVTILLTPVLATFLWLGGGIGLLLRLSVFRLHQHRS